MMAPLVHDHFDRYFAEKMWAMIPEHYREQDGLASPPGVLRGLVEVLAQQAATLRRSTDDLWDDQFIDLCAEWAVRYIGDLVATRLVSALNPRGRRVDVAKTMYYRRRAGTPRILEELTSDITGWEGKLVEEFRRLGRMRHGLDPHPHPLAGALTGTLPGGWANLRRAHGAELADSPFDEFHHTPDVRRPRGRSGRWGIAKLGFHLYRLQSIRLDNVSPCPGPVDGTFTFDPSGRDVPLFARRHRTDDRVRFDWEGWLSAKEWEVPSEIRCRVLNHAEYLLTEQVLAELTPFLTNPPIGLAQPEVDGVLALFRRFRGQRIPSEARLIEITQALTLPSRTALRNPLVWNPFLVSALVDDCGKRALLPIGVYPDNPSPSPVEMETSEASVAIETLRADHRFLPVARELVVAGNLEGWMAAIAAGEKEWLIDPHRGRFRWIGSGAPPPPPRVTYHYGFSGQVGAGGYDRAESFVHPLGSLIQDGGAIQSSTPSGTNFLPSADVVEVADSATYTPIDSRDQITHLELRAANRCRPYFRLSEDWRLDTSGLVDSTLTLNGLWIGAGGPFSLQLLGDYRTVVLRHVTLDPGGVDASGQVIHPVPLEVHGAVETLIIDRSIVGPIRVVGTGELTNLELRDSIVDGQRSSVPVLMIPTGHVHLRAVTIFGAVEVEWLDASNSLITGFTEVTNTQEGCFRFSAVLKHQHPLDPMSPQSRVPHPYESSFITDFSSTFTSRTFGRPGYGQLAESAPLSLRRGAANGTEMGVFRNLMNPIKYDSLRAKVEEFAPFGLLPIYLFET